MNKKEFKNFIKTAEYKTKYEPIIDTVNDTIFAYEALSKFEINEDVINTEEIFRKLHDNNKLFFELEKRNKIHQVNNFDRNKKLFLNFDADIVHLDEQKEYWENFLLPLKDKIVVEITENGSDDEKSAKIMQNFSQWLRERNIDSALDDFAQDGSMFSFFIMDRSKYIKIDKSFLRQVSNNSNYIHYLKGLVQTVKLNGQKCILEGIETKNDYDLAKHISVDYMQGYYFMDETIIK